MARETAITKFRSTKTNSSKQRANKTILNIFVINNYLILNLISLHANWWLGIGFFISPITTVVWFNSFPNPFYWNARVVAPIIGTGITLPKISIISIFNTLSGFSSHGTFASGAIAPLTRIKSIMTTPKIIAVVHSCATVVCYSIVCKWKNTLWRVAT